MMSVVGHQPPPIFKRGPAPLVRLLLLVSVCLAMLVADLRFRYLEMVRQGLSVITYPLQMAAATPADFVRNASRYFATLVEVQFENSELRQAQLDAAQRLLRYEQLEQENTQLRGLLQMSQRLQVTSQGAEILYSAPDPFARKVILNRGSQHGVDSGLAVVDSQGVIGQVTRVNPIQSEVTLLTDKDQAIPVQVVRNGLRGVLFGAGRGRLELRFVVSGADVQPGDRLVTSGLDGVFVGGLPVAVVTSVDHEGQAFAAIQCVPAAGVERSTQVLILGPAAPPRAKPLPRAAAAEQTSAPAPGREANKER